MRKFPKLCVVCKQYQNILVYYTELFNCSIKQSHYYKGGFDRPMQLYPSITKFEKIFQERVGALLADNNFVYTKKFRCYYRYISSEILQVYSNRIYCGNSAWDSYVGIYPLCEPDDVYMNIRLSWKRIYNNLFDASWNLHYWHPEARGNLEKERHLDMCGCIELRQSILSQYAIPQLNRIQSFSDYINFLQISPRYTAASETMASLLGRYGTDDEIDRELEEFIKESQEEPEPIKQWATRLVEQYTKVKKQRMREGAESFDPVLKKYTEATRTRLDEEMGNLL